jgi:dTDP-4-dehydrorhamnose 3,5-epimerase
MKVSKSKLEGVLVFRLDPFEDFRGEYVELFNEKNYMTEIRKFFKGTQYAKDAANLRFVEDDISTGTRGVIKGIHGDSKTWKLITCLYGKFYFVVLNHNKKSPSYGKWEAFNLSDKNRLQVLVPPLYGNGHLVTSDYSIFHYKQSAYYDPVGQFTVKWNDPEFKIWWPVKNPILSQRDKEGSSIED